MGKAVFQYVLVSVVQIAMQFLSGDSYKLEGRYKRQEQTTANVSSSTMSGDVRSTTNTTVVEFNSDASKVGLVVGVICGVLVAIVAMAIVVTIWIRNKRNRDSEYARAAKVQRDSTQSAGVYKDLTVTPIVKKPMHTQRESTEMDKLKNEEEEA